jgi:hypothetical protein
LFETTKSITIKSGQTKIATKLLGAKGSHRHGEVLLQLEKIASDLAQLVQLADGPLML